MDSKECNILIATREELGVSDNALFELYNVSFDMWRKHGLEADWLHLTQDSFKRQLHKKMIFVAIDKSKGEIIGMHALKSIPKSKGLAGSFLAVLPSVQRYGIATCILEYEMAYARNKNHTHLREYTAVNADWSVKWHLKNGYRIIGYNRSEKDNYASYLFHLQLVPSLLWSGPLAPVTAKVQYLFYRVATAILKDANGRPTLILKYVKKWRAKLSANNK